LDIGVLALRTSCDLEIIDYMCNYVDNQCFLL